MSNYLKSLVCDELDACTQAISVYIWTPMDFADELEHWTRRLNKATRALLELENVPHLTQSEWLTLRTLVEFHEGAYDTQEDAPFNIRDLEALLDKLRG